jgi:hypothetical protein
LVFAGTVPSVTVRQAPVNAGGITFQSVTVHLEGVRINRDAVLRGNPAVSSIDGGTVKATVDEAFLSGALGVPVVIRPDGLVATVGGRATAPIKPRVEGGALVVDLPGRAARVGIPSLPLLPCVEGIVLGDHIAELGCTVHEVPPGLLRAVQRAVAQPA